MSDTADRVAKAYDEKIDPNRLIPINEAFDTISFGVLAIKQTSDGIRNSFKKRLEQKQQINEKQKIQATRLLNAKKQKDKEEGLEKVSKSPLEGIKKAVNKPVGSLFNRIMTAAASIFAGWLLEKIPEITEAIANLVKNLQDIWEKITGVMNGIGNALKDLKEGSLDFLSRVRNLDFWGENESANISKELEGLEQELLNSGAAWDDSIEAISDEIKKIAAKGEGTDALQREAELSGEAPPPGIDTTKFLNRGEDGNVKEENNGSSDDQNNVEVVVNQKNDSEDVQELTEELTKVDGNSENNLKVDPVVVKKEDNSGITTETSGISNKEIASTFDTSGLKSFSNNSDSRSNFFNGIVNNNTLISSTDISVAFGDGNSNKVITPQGLGMDMYSRSIILNPDAARGWKKVMSAAAAEGLDLTKAVTSSYRSPEKQRELIAAEDGVNVITPAPVDRSPHVQGWAVDLAVGTPQWEWMKKFGPKYGWRWQGDSDPVHFDYMEGAPANDHWLQPGRNDWMQGNMANGEKLASISKRNEKVITVPMPINKGSKTPVTMGKDQSSDLVIATSNGSDIVKKIKTFNTMLT